MALHGIALHTSLQGRDRMANRLVARQFDRRLLALIESIGRSSALNQASRGALGASGDGLVERRVAVHVGRVDPLDDLHAGRVGDVDQRADDIGLPGRGRCMQCCLAQEVDGLDEVAATLLDEWLDDLSSESQA